MASKNPQITKFEIKKLIMIIIAIFAVITLLAVANFALNNKIEAKAENISCQWTSKRSGVCSNGVYWTTNFDCVKCGS